MAINELHLIADLSDPAVVRSTSAQLIDEMLREISYGDGAWNIVNRDSD
ncbi:hypothetical protein [Aurantimonas coralicida]|nr:hypothetical protein [Aurantimonas coralicida]